MRLLGTETEYGLYVAGRDPSQHLDEAAALVRAYAGRCATGWDYRWEDPRRDARGFRVDSLTSNPEDARYDRPGASRNCADLRSDRVLTNGARLYNDHGHPEYATPECLSPRELAAHDRAGERILLACARARAAHLGVPVRLYKNNTDYHGMSYGAHENYLMARRIPFEQVIRGLLPFLVTRQIFAGAGKVGAEPAHAGEALFQLSQRADFLTEEASVETLHRRPIVNTRDEPHANASTHRRLHVICGDANLSPFATWLRVGTTALVLSLLESGWQPPVAVREPVDTMRRISRDPALRWLVETEDGQTIPAVDVQRLYLQAARERDLVTDADYQEVAAAWEATLDALERDPLALADRLDWAAKRQLVEAFREAEGLEWSSEALRSLDLEYHNLDPDEGLFRALEAEGAILPLVTEEEVTRAMEHPPAQTRAAVRGACVRRFGPAIRSITWAQLVVAAGGAAISLDLTDRVDGSAAELAAALEQIESADELLRLAEELPGKEP